MTCARLALSLALAACLPACGSGDISLNELVARNATGVTDPNGGTPDWLELHNAGVGSVSLDGWFLSDDPTNPERESLNGLTVPAGGFLVLHASGDVTLGADHLSFKLSGAGEELLLTDPNGEEIDSVSWGELDPDTSWARVPDGVGDWQTAEPTAGASNGP